MHKRVLFFLVTLLALHPAAAFAGIYVIGAKADTWLKESAPSEKHGSDPELSCKHKAGDGFRTACHFDLSSIPPGERIVSAMLSFYVTTPDPSLNPVNVYRITENWTETGADWSNLSSDYDSLTVWGSFWPSVIGDIAIDVTFLVQLWVDGAYNNHGLMFIPTSDDVESKYASKEWGTPSQQPRLTVVTVESPLAMVTGHYVGDGTDDRPITGLKFSPDVVIVKADTTQTATLKTSTMIGDASKTLGINTELQSDRIQSLDAEGFTVGADVQVNWPGVDYYWTAFKASPGVLVVDTYVGDGNDDRSIPGVGFEPGYVIVMSSADEEAMQRFAAELPDQSLPFSNSDEKADRIQDFEPDGFQVGKHNTVNEQDSLYHYVAWNTAPGITNTGVYTGNDSSQDIKDAGFGPHYLIVKTEKGGDGAVQRPLSLTGDKTLPFEADSSFSDGVVAFLSDGFQVGSREEVNKNGDDYYWAAFRGIAYEILGADLDLTVEVDDTVKNEGDGADLLVTVTNNGPSDATGIQVMDLLPQGLTYVFHVATQGFYSETTGKWDVGSLSSGMSAGLSISTTVDSGTAGSTIVNTAAVTRLDQLDPVVSNNADSVSIRVKGLELSIAKFVDDPDPNVGDEINYGIIVTNSGPDEATGVDVWDQLPKGVTYVSNTPSQGSYSDTTGIWKVDTIPVGSGANLVLTGKVNSGTGGTVITNTAKIIDSDQARLEAVVDSASVDIIVQAADLVVGKIVDSPTPAVSDLITYTITVANAGPDSATAVQLTDTLPGGVTYDSDTPSQGSYISGTGIWDVGAIAPGDTATLTLSAIVDGGTSGRTINNIAVVTAADQEDPDIVNNSSFAKITVQSTEFRIASDWYSGDGALTRSITGVGFQPDIVILQGNDGQPASVKTASMPGTLSKRLARGYPMDINYIVSLDADGFTLSPDGLMNQIGAEYHWVALKTAPGYMVVGSYDGDGADDRAVPDVGFTPNYVMILPELYNEATQRYAAQTGDASMTFGYSDENPNWVQSFLSNGFEVGSDSLVNAPGPTYHYVAWQNIPGTCVGGSHRGDGNDNRDITAPGFQPDWVILKRLESSNGTVHRPASLPGDQTLSVTGGPFFNDGIQTLLPNGFQVGQEPSVNEDGFDYAWLALRDPTIPEADLDLTVGVNDSIPIMGDTLTYALTLINNGPDIATSVQVIDLLPTELMLLSDDPDQGTYNNLTGLWDVGDVSVGDTLQLRLSARLDGGEVDSTISNTAAVVAVIESDPDESNNSAGVDVRVGPSEFRVVSGSYIGDGFGNHAVTGLGFKPDVVIIKGDLSQSAVARVSTMTGDITKPLGISSAVLPDLIKSLDDDGFTVGLGPQVNQIGIKYYWTAFRAAKPELAVGTYVGDGIDDRSITGLRFEPAYVVVMDEEAQDAIQRYPSQAGDASLVFDSGSPVPDRIQAFNPDGFDVGRNPSVNKPGDAYHYVAWKAVAGRSTGNLYIGNGEDNRDIENVGFRPDFVVTARSEEGSPAVYRTSAVYGDSCLPVDAIPAFGNGIQTLLAEGFQVGSHEAVNHAGDLYYWMAFDDNRTVDLAVTKIVDNPSPNVADTLTYTVTVSNEGSGEATFIEITDVIPAGLSYYGDTPSQGSYNSSTGVWFVGDLGDSASADLQLNVVVDPGTGGTTIVNTASLTSLDQADVDADNNSDSAEITVRLADLGVAKYVDNLTPSEGDTIRYTVILSNDGPDDATGVSLTDSLPPGVTYLADTASAGMYDPGTGLWAIETVANTSSDTLFIYAVVDVGAMGSSVVNTAYVAASDVADPDGDDDTATAEILVPTPITLDDVPGSLFPNATIVGDPDLALRIGVDNPWAVGVTLDTASTIVFSDSTNTFVSRLSNPTYVPAGASEFILAFSSAPVPAAFIADSTYSLELSLEGTTDEAMAFDQTIPTVGTNAIYVDQPRMALSTVVLGNYSVNPGQHDVGLLLINFENNYSADRTLDSLTVTNAASGPGSQAQLDQLTSLLRLYDDVDADHAFSAPDTVLAASVFAAGRASFAPGGGWTIGALAERTIIVTADVDSVVARDGDVLDAVVVQPTDFVFAESTTVDQTISPSNPLDSYGSATIDGMMSHQITQAPSTVDTLLSGLDDVLVLDLVLPQNGYQADTLIALNIRDYSGNFDPDDFSAVHLYRDDGDGTFEPFQDDYVGEMVFSGDRYEISGVSKPIGPGERFFVAVDVAVDPTNGDRFQPGIPLDGIEVHSNNDGPVDAAIVSPVSHVIKWVEKIVVASLPLTTHTPKPGDEHVGVLLLNVQNNTLQPSSLDSLRLYNQTAGPGTQAQLDGEISEVKVYLDDGNGTVDAWETPLAEGMHFLSGALTTPALGLTLPPGGSSHLLFTCDVDSFCVRDQDSLRVQVSSSSDLFFNTAFPIIGTFPMTTQEARSIDGMVSFQLSVFPSSDSLLITESTDILVLDVAIPGNGYDADTLRSLNIENLGTASDEHVQTLKLYADGGNGVFEATSGDDTLIGTFVSLGGNQYQMSGIDYPLPAMCPAGVRYYVACDLTSDFLNGATFQFGIPTMGINVYSGNDGPWDMPVLDPSTQLIPRPDELTIFPYSVGDKRVFPVSTDVLNFGMGFYNGYQTTVTLDSILLFQAEVATGAEILSVKAFADSDTNGLFDPAADLALATGLSTEPYYYGFSNLALDLPPAEISYLFIAYDLATDVRDSVGVDFQLNFISELLFTPASVSVKGVPPINSPGVDLTDGMIAAQIGLHPARAGRVAPGDEHVLAMGLTIPANGFTSDRLNQVTILNSGTAVTGQDVSTLNLWAEDGGNPDDFSPAEDRLLSAMLWTGGGWQNPIALDEHIPLGGSKCYVTFSTPATANDGRTFQAVLPVNGIQVLSGNDGPLDQTVVNPNEQTLSTDPLITSVSTDRSSYSVGQDIVISMQARNEGVDTLYTVTAPALTLVGTATALYQSGPTPTTVDLLPNTDTTLVWLYTSATPGELEICGFAHNGDSTEVSEQTCSETIAVQNKPSDLALTLTDATPIGVNVGQDNVDAISIDVEYAIYDSLSASANFKGLTISVEDGAGVPLAPNSILSQITLVSSSGSNQPFALIDSTLNPLRLHLQEPVAVLPGAAVGLDLDMDIADSTTASQFRLSLALAADVSVVDANDGIPVTLTTGASFPWKTNLIDVAIAAESLVVYSDDAGVQYANLGQDGVRIFNFKLVNNGPPTAANEVLKNVVLSFYDTTGAALPPNDVINTFTLESDGSSLYVGEDIPSSGNTITCNLTNALLLPPQTEKEINVIVDLKSFPQSDGFSLALVDPGSITARDNNSGDLVVVSAGGITGSFPVTSPMILFQAPASGISTVHASRVPPDILPSTSNVPLLETIYTHADTNGSASIVVDSLAMVFIDRLGNPVYPGNYFSQLRVIHSGDTLTALPSLSSLDNVVECAFSTPVTFVPMAAETFLVFVDAKELFSPAEFQVRIERRHVVAHDANTGERILAITGSFPFLSDPSRLQLAGGAVACGLDSRLPANVSGNESALPAFDFIIQNNDPPGYTSSELRSLAVATRTWDGKSIDPGEIVAGATVMRGDSTLASGVVGPSIITLSLPDSAVITAPGTRDTLTIVVDLDAKGDHTFRFVVLDTSSIDIRDAVTAAPVTAGTIGDVGYPLMTDVSHLLGADPNKAFTNYPNPFAAGREDTRITYYLDAAARITLTLYTLWGAEVATLVAGQAKAAGLHQDVVWSGKNDDGDVVNNGVYYLVLEVNFDTGGTKEFRRKVGVIR